MSFIDEIKNRLPFGQPQDDYADDYAQDGYDDEYYEDGGYGTDEYGADDHAPYASGHDEESSHGVLGQTRRGEAESIAVYTRSGQLVGDADRHATTYNPPSRTQDTYRPGAYDTPSSYAASKRTHLEAVPGSLPTSTERRASSILNATPQLPAYILRPESYDDVETVVRRVRTKQPVALVFVGVRTEIAMRVLDFSYGFACGLGASVREIGDRVFMVLPAGCDVADSDIEKLRSEGYLK